MWIDLPMVVKALIGAVLIIVSLLAFPQVAALGYTLLFLGLIVIFETLGLSLFYKILIALALGIILAATQAINGDQFMAMKPIGSKIFLNLLTLALVPLVFSSILTGVTHLADLTKLRRIGTKAILYFLTTTVVAVTIGLTVANIFQPGEGISDEARALFEKQASSKQMELQTDQQVSLYEVIQNIIPTNILSAVSQSRPDMLAIIMFAMLCGIALLNIDQEKAEVVVRFFDGVTEMTIQIVNMVMRVAPYGVFAIIGATLAQSEGFDILYALLPFSFVVLLALFLHAAVVSTVSLKVMSQRPIIKTIMTFREVLITAFSTASSGATMPFTMKVVERDLKVKKEVSSFVISLGATINMDGTSLFQGVSAIFLANMYGIDLSMVDQITVVVMAVLASIGTAAVPGVGIVMLMMILSTAGIPSEGILFILPVNHILDMFRTAVNVCGDMCCALYINKVEGEA